MTRHDLFVAFDSLAEIVYDEYYVADKTDDVEEAAFYKRMLDFILKIEDDNEQLDAIIKFIDLEERLAEEEAAAEDALYNMLWGDDADTNTEVYNNEDYTFEPLPF